MPTIVTCHHCGQRFQAEDFLAGRRVPCPMCRNALLIPAANPPGSSGTFTPQAATASPAQPYAGAPPHTQERESGVNQPLMIIVCAIGGSAVLLLLLLLVASSAMSNRGEAEPATGVTPAGSTGAAVSSGPVEPPQGVLLYQPALAWANDEVTCQGTGFLASTPDGRTVGITSAHFVEFDGPRLQEMVWLDVYSDEPRFHFPFSLGPPGKAGRLFPLTDLRTDYMILVSDEPVANVPRLELDPRRQPSVGERVWFPNKDSTRPVGYVMLEGTVTRASPKYAEILIKPAFRLQSQSGSPVISQKTGKVIGTLAGGGPERGGIGILTAPSRSILDAMERAGEPLPLQTVVGR